MQTNELQLPALDRNARLGRYCAAGAGAAVLAGAVTTADAGIVFVNFNNQVFVDTTPTNGSPTFFSSGNAGNFDFNTDGVIDFRLQHRSSLSSASQAASNLAGFNAPLGANIDVIGIFNGDVYPSRLAAGTLIGPAGPFVTLTNGATGYLASANTTASQWGSASGPAFVGVRFTINAEVFFGWVGLTVSPNELRRITLSGFAYENTPNTPIVAGAIPEPSSLALLALGGVGLLAYRRRNARKNAA